MLLQRQQSGTNLRALPQYNQEPKNLTEKLTPGTDQSFTGYGDTVSLEYKWQGNNHLTVTQLFNGGQDTISFETDGQGTWLLQNTVRINYPAKLLVLVTLN